MPAVNFLVGWPDGERVNYYSPSTIIGEYLAAGQQYELAAFEQRIAKALSAASERVYQRFGYYCSASEAELQKIQHKLQSLREAAVEGPVEVLALTQ